MFKRISSAIFLFLSVVHLFAQVNWTAKNMFEQKNFIENKGQFNDIKLPNGEQVLFSAEIDGVRYYFTKNGYTIVRKELVEKKEAEKEREENETSSLTTKNGEDEESRYKEVEKFHELKFANTNPLVEILSENKVSNYYSYPELNNPGKKATIIANAYTRLVYKNLYQNTDVVFEFPKDSTGIKYSIYLHPGADVGNIKMFFPDNNNFELKNNNIEINSAFGKIIDHQPVSYTLENKSLVKSNFKISGNQIGFEIENNVANKTTIVIDPWITTPSFSGSSNAFDIDYDNQGNVYVYGTKPDFVAQLLKYSNSGALIWSLSSTAVYGDFAIDRNTNNVFIAQGATQISGWGAIIWKFNSSAIMLGNSPNNQLLKEMWRIAFNRCGNQAVIGGGGITVTAQTCYLDTTLASLSPVKYIQAVTCCHDISSIALDNYGNCYQLTNSAPPAFSDGLFQNQLVKLPLPSFLPVTYHVNTNYALNEGGSNYFYGANPTVPIGYNGLTTSDQLIFSYDSYVLKKWDGPTGNLLSYKRIKYPIGADSSHLYWEGISADDCGNLFLADSNIVRQYDTALT